MRLLLNDQAERLLNNWSKKDPSIEVTEPVAGYIEDSECSMVYIVYPNGEFEFQDVDNWKQANNWITNQNKKRI